jgi:NADH-quinone oxidoreductase subunit L
MEAPTPVSALIHAATMVTAGVYIVARNAVLFSHAPLVLQTVAIIGVLTALTAAAVGLAQNDIKRVLAYSTVSQLGFMFLAAGAGAYGAAIFHLVTHAFFKALLFLGAGAVIHTLSGEQDLRRMGGLQTRMPVTYVTMTIGALAIAAIPPLSGFFSKDAILARAFTHSRGLWALGVLTAALTAFYMFRLIFLTFHREYRGAGNLHPHEPAAAMRYPLVALAVGAIVAGFIGTPALIGGGNSIDRFLAPAFGPAPPPPHLPAAVEVGLMVVSTGVAAFGIVLARRMYVLSPEVPSALARRWPVAHDWLLNGYYLDDLYRFAFVRGLFTAARGLLAFDRRVVDGIVDGVAALARIAAWCSRMFDKYVVDGLVNLTAWGAGEGSFLVRRVQTGLVQNYALLTILGLFAFLTLFLMAR